VQEVHVRIKDLESYKAALFQLYKNWDNQKFLAIKCGIVSMEIVPSDVEADTIIQSLVENGSVSGEDRNALTAWTINLFFNLARKSKRVFCFHTGPVIGSQDFRLISPEHVMPWGACLSGCVENVYGALEMTRENLATALTQRITRGLMDIDETKFILQRILVANGEEWYNLYAGE
jgi:hypothetical protein